MIPSIYTAADRRRFRDRVGRPPGDYRDPDTGQWLPLVECEDCGICLPHHDPDCAGMGGIECTDPDCPMHKERP